jgi:predicted dehydrogenase
VTDSPVRVGLVGASLPHGRWAIEAHAPAIVALDGFGLDAVATTRRESAEAAAQAFGARAAYDSAEALIADPRVELVVVAVNVRAHAAVVRAALAAGKHVLCEWPLALDTPEAEELASLAAQTGVVTAVGLQARAAPAVRRARELIAEGYVGELRSAQVTCSSQRPGSHRLPEAYAWQLERRGGATVLTIPASHALDAVCFLGGDLSSVSAQVLSLDPAPVIEETGATVARNADDHVALTGRTVGGAVVSALFQGGSPAGIASRLELRGDEGVLSIATTQPRQLQISSLTLHGTRDPAPPEPIEIPARLTAHIPEALLRTPSEHVAGIYAELYDALRHDGAGPADFELAVGRHRLIDAIERSAAEHSSLHEIVATVAGLDGAPHAAVFGRRTGGRADQVDHEPGGRPSWPRPRC